MTPILAFDIETIPDVAGLRRVQAPDVDLADDAVLEWYMQKRRTQTGGGDFVPLQFQKVVAIACALRDSNGLKIASVGSIDDGEPELIRRFFDLVDKYTPQLVSWNGSGFDLPVLHYRALIHGVTAARYWDWGDEDREFKFNNYLGRYHTRHIDLMDVLSMYQQRATAGLDAIARLCGFPGKLGMDGSDVRAAVLAGKLDEVRRYCETDVMNTYLVYQRFRLMRGEMTPDDYAQEILIARERITATGACHWQEFLAAWDANAAK
jgi:predicted PolB exonuclease-like 3'-5' exonuclease